MAPVQKPLFDPLCPLRPQLAGLQSAIRLAPADASLRVYLFQLLCVLGDWTKALAQLQTAARLDPAAVPMAQSYREVIRCEVLRAAVWAGHKTPAILGQPEPWLAWLVSAAGLQAQGAAAAASRLRTQAFDCAPCPGGEIDGQAFEWLADADARLGPVAELFIHGRYHWVPFAAIRQIEIAAPQDLRDLVWTPCELTLGEGGRLAAFIPTRYQTPGAEPDDAQLLARATAWQPLDEVHAAGIGQRVWTSGDKDHALLDVRRLHFAV